MASLNLNRRIFGLGLVLMTLAGSQLFAQRPQCGFRSKRTPVAFKAPSDCGQNQAVILPEYNAGELLTIRTVVHVIHRADGQGKLSEAAVRAQIETLNRDFRAPNAVQNGYGNDATVEFQLASLDPQGNPTNGIIYTENDAWFAGELAEYGRHLVWDPTRYMNVYFTDGEGAGGVVYQLPWEPNPVPGFEGLVVAYPNAEDDNSVITHEVGHYLGLEHTFGFDESCPTGDCYKTGDFLCDTGTHTLAQNPTCDPRQPCGEEEPVINYMNYTDCLLEFTPEQINRMRCSLFNFRSDILTTSEPKSTIESRWIPHITKTSSDFDTGLFLTNTMNQNQTVNLNAYDAMGTLLTEQSIELTGLSRRYADIGALFEGVAPSHIGIAGQPQVTISAAYSIEGTPTVSAHLAEFSDPGRVFLLHLGEWDVVFDGIALLNVGPSPAKVTVKPWREQSTPGEAVILAEAIPSRGKALADLEAYVGASGATMVLIEADQPILVLGLRGSKPGSDLPFLFANPMIKIQ